MLHRAVHTVRSIRFAAIVLVAASVASSSGLTPVAVAVAAPPGPGLPTVSAVAVARQHLDRVAQRHGVTSRDLRTMSARRVAGRDVVRFQQTRAGIPVFAGQLVTVLDGRGRLLSVSGETSRRAAPAGQPGPGTASSYDDVFPFDFAASSAASTAQRATASRHGVSVGSLQASRPTRWLLDRSLLEPGAAPGLRPVWRVQVSSASRPDVRDLVLVDARTGRVALRLSEVATLDRVVCDDVRTQSYDCGPAGYVRVEGSGPTGLVDADQAYDLTGATATWFANQLGVDLTALIGNDLGDGRRLRSTTNYCPPDSCPLDNAFWSGSQMVYGAGYTSADDVVAHELSHGVTQNTAGLVYWYQSGAINESMSDVFGELADLGNGVGNDGPEVRWALGEDLPPAAGGVTRNMADPPRYRQPDVTSSPLYDPAPGYDDSGAVHSNSGVPNKTAYLISDGTVAEPGGAFRGRAFAGIGPARTATLYWATLLMLTPGADFADLGAALRQACANLAFAATECATVAAAVEATELEKAAGPQAPRALRVRAGDGEVRLAWSPPASTGAARLRSYVVAVTPRVKETDFFTVEPTATSFALTGLAAGVDYRVSLLAVTSEGSSAPLVRSLSGTRLAVSAPRSVRVGDPIRVRGSLFNVPGAGLRGRRAVLVAREPGATSYGVVDQIRTGADGSFTFRPFDARRRTQWYVAYPGAGTELGVRSARQQSEVRQRVRVTSDSPVRPGRVLRLAGTVSPPRSGLVALQRRAPVGRWVTVEQSRVQRGTGRWALTWPVRGPVPVAVRVRVGARPSAGLAAGTSAVLTGG